MNRSSSRLRISIALAVPMSLMVMELMMYTATSLAIDETGMEQTVWPIPVWSTATPAQMGMDEATLGQARDNTLTGGGAGYITREGRLVMSWGNPAQRYSIKSATKSIGITALGLAIQDGLMRLSDQALLYQSSIGIPPDSNVDTGWLDDITIQHLATHTAGFKKHGGYTSLLFAPGTKWAYSDGGPNWLAECLTLTYGQDLNILMFERVFTPLGITTSALTWRKHRYRSWTIEGIERREFASGIMMSVDAMARIGYLYLRGGQWNGQQIVPQDFVDMVRTTLPEVVGLPVDPRSIFAESKASDHYGLLWWNNTDGALANIPRDAYWAYGLGNNFIIVIPSLDIVVSRAGSAWSGSRTRFLELIVASVQD
jgi:CubicO group peptidase (beta-lactamase class C family)